MKVVIVGGVAGGASCAARLRRLDEQAEILPGIFHVRTVPDVTAIPPKAWGEGFP